MAVNPRCIVERFYIFKHKPICMAVIYDMEPSSPFPLDQEMEAFYAGIGEDFQMQLYQRIGELLKSTAHSPLCAEKNTG